MNDSDSGSVNINDIDIDDNVDNNVDMSDDDEVNTKTTVKKKNESTVAAYIKYYDQYVKKFGKVKTLVLMQVGSFYETYATVTPLKGPDLSALEELTDASIAHKGKNKNVVDVENPWMWGFPMVSSSKYFGILIDAGYRLIIVDQITPKPNITREVVAVYSAATYLDATYKPASNFVAVICIEEIKQKNNQVLACIGMSAIDVSTGQVLVHESYSSMSDDKLGLDETIRFLNSIVPKETIIFKENLQRLTEDYIVEYLELEGRFYQFRDINKEHIKLIYQKKILEKVYPDRENMTSIIDTLELSKFIYVRKSFINLLTYISDHYEDLVKGIMEPVFYMDSSFMVLGNDAINQLNIVDNKNVQDVPGSVKFHTLLDVINKASTGMGKRYIKMRLTSPYTNIKTLNQIYDIVDIMMIDSFYEKTNNELKNVHDLERMYRKISLSRLYPLEIVNFIDSMKAIDVLFEIIKENEQLSAHIEIDKFISPIKKLIKLLEDTIDREKAKSHTMSDITENIFNKGVYPKIDALQKKIGSNHDIIDTLLNELDALIAHKTTGKGKRLVLKHNGTEGYYYQITKNRYAILKKELTKVKTIVLDDVTIDVDDFEIKTVKSAVKLSLPFLKQHTGDINRLIEKIGTVTHEYYIKFLKQITEDYGECLKEVIDIITKMDFYTTIAKVSKAYNYVRPVIGLPVSTTPSTPSTPSTQSTPSTPSTSR